MEEFFRLKERGTNVRTEIVAGLTTFMVMAYIIFVNPSILSAAGVPAGPALVATCVVAGAMTLLMGLWTNYPYAIAPGMGINSALVALVLTNAELGLTWQEAMGVIFLEGLLITILVLTGLREAIMNAIPMSLKRAISVGIGLFILFIGLFNAGFVRTGVFPLPDGSLTGPLTALGLYNSLPILVAVVGLLFTLLLLARRVRGALLWGILGTTVFAIALRYLTGNPTSVVPGAAEIPPLDQILVAPSFATFGSGLNLGVFGKLGVITAALTIFSFMLSDFFDTMGTVIGIGAQAGWVDERTGSMPRLREILVVDSLAAMFGGIAGSSSATTYIESAAGVEEGGRSGLTSVVVGILFLLAVFLSPLAGVVPQEATAAALILVGFLMVQQVREIPFDRIEEGVPALFTIVFMPFAWSITNGIAWGFVTYVFLKVAMGKGRQVSGLLYGTAVAFVLYLALPAIQALL
ncbi:MAG: NCS2 family permease [Anaerolineae bacterium]|nr:NCS2 family permease [Anaerolineae bacterium]